MSTTVPVRNVSGVVDAENESKNPEVVLGNFHLIPAAIEAKLLPKYDYRSGCHQANPKGENAKADFWVSFN